ncbi:MAG: hypothetical protein M3082_16620 [Candidatus Dormibacteraeota bacterium]|nr:hypothetical protein [Candidatus Dormibacteraeota bacterium]
MVALTLRFGPEVVHMGYEGIALLLLAIPVGISAIVLGVIGLVRAPSRGDIGIPWALAGILGGFIAAAAALAWLLSPRLLI